MNTLAVFRSRSDALKLYNLLRRNKIACATVNTPAKMGIGCGISVVFNKIFLEEVKRLIGANGLKSFVSFYER